MTRILWYMALVQSGTVDHATIVKIQNHFINTFFLLLGVPITKHATVCDFTVLNFCDKFSSLIL